VVAEEWLALRQDGHAVENPLILQGQWLWSPPTTTGRIALRALRR
jgi:hypothetical protein